MEPIKTQSGNNEKYYSVNAIGICTLLFGPLAGCYMMYQNFVLIGDTKSAKVMLNSVIVGFVVIGMYILIPFTLPFSKAWSFLLAGAIWAYSEKSQKQKLVVLNQNGAAEYSIWHNLLVSCLALIITIVYIFIIVFASNFMR